MRSADLRSRLAALRRHAGVLTAAGVLGLALGSAYVVLAPAPLTSTSLVLLPTPALADSSNSDVATQIRIALSANNLDLAGAKVQPQLSAREVEKRVKITGATDQLLQVDATSTNGAQAQALSQAVADTYVNYVRNTAQEVTKASLADLTSRRDDLQSQLDRFQQELTDSTKRRQSLDPGSPEDLKEAQLHADLQTQQGVLVSQLDKVKEKIAGGTPVGTAATGTAVVQQATVPEGTSPLIRLLTWGPAGALAALLLAALVVLVVTRTDARLRLRDDIADALGSPVLASVRSRPQRAVAGWSALLESYQGTPMESWAFRQVLRALAPSKGQVRVAGRLDHPESVTVVSFAGDDQGLALGVQLAIFASSLGILTRFVPAAGQDRAPTLWACATEHSTSSTRSTLLVGQSPGDEQADLTVYTVVVDRTLPGLRDVPESSATVISVASGAATEQELARVAVAVDDAGRRIDGIVIADPDEADRTSGRHTVSERAQWPTLPTRLTGVTGVAASTDGSRGRS